MEENTIIVIGGLSFAVSTLILSVGMGLNIFISLLIGALIGTGAWYLLTKQSD